jgi:hypothetical protein
MQNASLDLRRLTAHFKLIVLSNVDRTSFRHTHALLSGELDPTPESRLELRKHDDAEMSNISLPRFSAKLASPTSVLNTVARIKNL